MAIDIRHNAPQVERDLLYFIAAFPDAQKQALSVAGESLFVASRNFLTRLVYNQEIPKRKNGKLAWRRKMRNGGLLGAETYALKSNGTEFVIFTDPSSPAFRYHIFRHYLNRRSPIDGRVRRAPWRTETAKSGTARAVQLYRDDLGKQMEARNWRSRL